MFENGQLAVLNIQDILPNRFQPRIRFDSEKLEELAESISKYGVIQPIVVRPINNKFEIIAGERRFKASKLASKSTIPAIIINLSDKDSEEIALLENVQRQQLNPIEEAVSYKRILDIGYISQEDLAKKIGKAQSTIVNKIRLLNLDDEVQSYLLNNKISERHARSLLRISNKELQVKMLHRIVLERLTVKQTDKEIAKLKENGQIENEVAKPVNIEVPNIPSVNQNNSVEEIESLFDENDDINLKNKEGGNSMDIDKIMREAKDINVHQEPKDISMLMQNGEKAQNVEIQNQGNLENNKFINVNSEVNQSSNIQKPINSGVTFDSMFNQHINIESSNENKVNVDSVLNNQSNNVSDEVSDDTKKVISSAVADALKRFNQKKKTVMTEKQVINNAENQSIPELFENNIPNTDIIADNSLNEYALNSTANGTMASTMVQDVKPVNNQARFASVVKLLRDCADKIEQSGYFVNVDELDLGNQYKVTFTIDKE